MSQNNVCDCWGSVGSCDCWGSVGSCDCWGSVGSCDYCVKYLWPYDCNLGSYGEFYQNFSSETVTKVSIK